MSLPKPIMSKSTALRVLKAISTPLSSQLPVSCRSTISIMPASAALRPFSTTTCVSTPVSMKLFGGGIDQAPDSQFQRASDNDLKIMVPDKSYVHLAEQEWQPDTRYHLHIYSHKHNTHITFTKPNRDAIISLSCGNIGFKGAGRSSYDAAYQLAAYVIARIQDLGHIPQIEKHKLELVYRGFGQGREAVTKAILGTEGAKIRSHIVKLSDSTRLKFGGTRSKKPRRLG